MMPQYTRFSISTDKRVAVIKMMRPEKKNALDTIMIAELHDICRHLNGDDNIGVAILTGTGNIFSAGGDISDWGKLSPDAFAHSWLREGNAGFDALARLRQPLIAVLNGLTLGGGLELAACADYRIGEDACKIGLPETTLGVVAGWSGTQRLSRRFGAQLVRRMAIFGEVFSAGDALSLGLIDQLEKEGAGLTTALSLAHSVLEKSSLATQVTKMMLNAAEGEGSAHAVDMLAGRLVASGADIKEGLKAFAEKRAPNYSDNSE